MATITPKTIQNTMSAARVVGLVAASLGDTAHDVGDERQLLLADDEEVDDREAADREAEDPEELAHPHRERRRQLHQHRRGVRASASAGAPAPPAVPAPAGSQLFATTPRAGGVLGAVLPDRSRAAVTAPPPALRRAAPRARRCRRRRSRTSCRSRRQRRRRQRVLARGCFDGVGARRPARSSRRGGDRPRRRTAVVDGVVGGRPAASAHPASIGVGRRRLAPRRRRRAAVVVRRRRCRVEAAVVGRVADRRRRRR